MDTRLLKKMNDPRILLDVGVSSRKRPVLQEMAMSSSPEILYLVLVSCNRLKKNDECCQMLFTHWCKTPSIADSDTFTDRAISVFPCYGANTVDFVIISPTLENDFFALSYKWVIFAFLRSWLLKSLMKDEYYGMNRQ